MIYVPRHFAVDERPLLLDTMRAHSFGLLVCNGGEEPMLSHLPFVIEERGGGVFVLGHVARANEHWRALDGRRALAVFSCPHAYIAPRWYTTRRAVPTWNYVAVHAAGVARVRDDPEFKRVLLGRLVAQHDAEYQAQFETLDAPFVDAMLNAIVGFEIAVDRLEGKFKLSQNRAEDDRRNVRAAMEQGGAPERELAQWMRRLGIGGVA